jgi:hypothetical protein
MSNYTPDPMFNDPPKINPWKKELKIAALAIAVLSAVLGLLCVFGVLE